MVQEVRYDDSDKAFLHGRIDISFEDLSYSVKTGVFKREYKDVLREVSGHFRAGELTAIVGQSGAGKSTLMDIIAGFSSATSGCIRTNGLVRDEKSFRKQSCYIMQDDVILPLLTVAEAMRVSSKLKLGSHISDELKELRVSELIRHLGLEYHKDTRTGNLSGGQRKRLAIGLELIPDPPVVLLDEPTSGLDSSTALQLMMLLRKFAHQGRTIVISCHQPGGRLLELIDSLYGVAAGRAVFTGSVPCLVPYLSRVGLDCPENHFPLDFLMEHCADSGVVERLVKCCDNGKSQDWRHPTMPTPKIYLNDPSMAFNFEDLKLTELPQPKYKRQNCCSLKNSYNTSQWSQFSILLIRALKIIIRDHQSTLTRLFISLIVALLMGTLYYDIGSDGTYARDNFHFLCMSLMFIMFTAFSSVSVKFPLDLPMIRREHFNRWYSSGAYFLSSLTAEVPMQAMTAAVYTIPSYYLTGQPHEPYRIAIFFLVLTMVSLVGASLGLLNGATFDLKNGMVWGSFSIAPWLIFSGVFLRRSDAHPLIQWLFSISYLRHGLVGLCIAIFSSRETMRCPITEPGVIPFCPFADPKVLMQERDIPDQFILLPLFYMFVIFSMFSTSAFLILKLRLKYKR